MTLLDKEIKEDHTIRSFAILLGNLLLFISFFFPWYQADIEGTHEIYSGYMLANTFSSYWLLLYFIPLISALTFFLALLYVSKEEFKQIFDFSPQLIAGALSLSLLVITFTALFLSPPDTGLFLLNGLEIGGYTAITGSLLAFITAVYPSS